MAKRYSKRGGNRGGSRRYSNRGNGRSFGGVQRRGGSRGRGGVQTVRLVIATPQQQQVAYPGMALPGTAAVAPDGLMLGQPATSPRKSRF